MGFHIARIVEHCSANAEATYSDPFEGRKMFFELLRNCLKMRFNLKTVDSKNVGSFDKFHKRPRSTPVSSLCSSCSFNVVSQA